MFARLGCVKICIIVRYYTSHSLLSNGVSI
nr:MAG TPA: hypothetical protein [Caudoviricetes sp.]